MVARSPKQIIKAHELRKRVRAEKQRLRKMHPKKTKAHGKFPKASPRVHIKLEADAKEALMMYCFKNNVKPYKAIKQILNMMMNKDWQALKEKVSKEKLEELVNGI
jgi:hypothetical protein